MPLPPKNILMLGCFDTKGEVFAYLRNCILALGENVISINTGVMGTTNLFPVDFESDVVALQGGSEIFSLRKLGDRGHAMDVMGKGAAEIVKILIAEGKLKAAIGMGGGGGTYITLSAMQQIPFGIPKLCLTTIAAKDLSRQIGHKDITLVPSVVDVAGLNIIIKVLISQSAAAICAMANISADPENAAVKRIAISMFGNTTACVDKCTELLTKEGYEVLAFHATGIGGRTMEALIREGYFDAVLDVTTTELADDLCGGICSAGPERLLAAGEMNLPQVVAPGCLDMVNFGHADSVPEKYKDRFFYSWAPDVTLMRTSIEENRILGKQLIEKLNKSASPVSVVLPLKGISQIDSAGGIFYKPENDQALFDSIKNHAAGHINIIESDAHINDNSFAEILVKTLIETINKAKKQAL
ncbi:Tm-1-like ATP-binding domain-containing protein [Dyadobacter subterraneus]|uniref:Tm-1-like ATP-binding domain-containing protein n=1 Tax=Dyadobacter subterraneus TaxID=2773304 RepID=A0ABR9WDF3_9BACT|nr:Tm-1-like ATP-binding domain-containing protein [Dyadobacter subterraneus]MBE9463505.1 Tm-1-like ATP-binding domain-containing protein [Dyadobacter subterraneus]